ncbi:cache domain-containing sensor histidine kinase [Amphibacillus sediminis]|uniref:cache domain-containing sensor histidine kinase n=1 Tax=Amphibacillus sediminis TaxID=360185 RepID=UPI000834F5B1|nr:sensor histidine kinase [Amphibacillus sediminis]
MNWLIKCFNRSLRNKVIVASIACIFLPVTISLTLYQYFTNDAVREQAIQNANKEMKLTEEYVSKIFQDMLYIINFVQFDTRLNALLKKQAEEGFTDQSPATYEEFLEDRTVMNTIKDMTLLGEKAHVTILLKNGKAYTNYPVTDYDPLSFIDTKWFEELNGLHGYESFWVETEPTVFQAEKIANPYQISVARTLRDEQSIIYGYVIVTMFENKISAIFENSNQYEEVMLLGRDHTILSHPDQGQIGKKFPYVGYGRSAVTFINGEEYLVTTSLFENNHWRIASIIPYNQSVSNIDSVFNRVFLLLILLFAVFLVILAYLIRHMTKPLHQLTKVVKQVQAGDLHVRTHVTSEDEIGQFSLSFDHMLDRINEMINEINQTQTRKRQAELAMLQAQINPHFLFNVLNSIRLNVYKFGDQESASMISSLSKLLRMTIDVNKGMITLKEEIEIIKDYMQIMNMRQKEKATLMINVTKEAEVQLLPRFVLQPLIENSIIHGFNQNEGIIEITAYLVEQALIIKVADNGQGIPPEKLENLIEVLSQNHLLKGIETKARAGFSSIGLFNVNERLKMTFGPMASVTIVSGTGKGAKIMLAIPLEKGVINHVQGDVG